MATNEVPKPDFGHQLDADTLCLYKMGDLDAGVFSGTAVDEVGNNNLAILNTPRITWGPAGGSRRDVFARWFRSSTDELEVAVGAALRTHIVEDGGEWTLEILLRPDTGTTFRGPFTINGSGEGAGGDFLVRIGGTENVAGRSWEMFWERSGANQQITLPTGSGPAPGEWAVIHVVVTDRSGDSTRRTVNFWQTLGGEGSATLLGTFDENEDFAQGTGLKPLSTSGTSALIRIGNADGASATGWFGAIGSVRILDAPITEAQINTAAQELLAQGEVTDGLTALAYWKLNEPPDLVDEGQWGFHLNGSPAGYRADNGITDCRLFDIVGTGGRARAASNNSFRMERRMDDVNFTAANGRQFHHYFDDTVDTVPSYTIAAWFLYAAREPGATRFLAQWDGSSESLASNFLFQFTLNASFQDGFFAERGSGTNIVQTPANSALLNVNEAGESDGRFHWAIVVKEDTESPGEMRIEQFINGVFVAVHSTGVNIPQGGTSSRGILFGPWTGWVQDIKVSRVARSEAEILADYERGAEAGGLLLQFQMRGRDTTLSSTVYWLATVEDTAADQYTGPGPVTGVVLSKKLGT